MFSYAEMLSTIRAKYPDFIKGTDDDPNDTSKGWRVPGFRGKVGFITSMVRLLETFRDDDANWSMYPDIARSSP